MRVDRSPRGLFGRRCGWPILLPTALPGRDCLAEKPRTTPAHAAKRADLLILIGWTALALVSSAWHIRQTHAKINEDVPSWMRINSGAILYPE
jgi:hypothetical protein